MSYWLIELKTSNGSPRWYSIKDRYIYWTDDTEKALRFSRKSDADQILTLLQNAEVADVVYASEHMDMETNR